MGRSVEMLSAPLPDCRCRVRNSSMTHRPTRSMVSYIQIKAVAMCTTGGKPKTGQVNEQEGGGGGGGGRGDQRISTKCRWRHLQACSYIYNENEKAEM